MAVNESFFDRLAGNLACDDDLIPWEPIPLRARKEGAFLRKAVDARLVEAKAQESGFEVGDPDLDTYLAEELHLLLRALARPELERLAKRVGVKNPPSDSPEIARAIHAQMNDHYSNQASWSGAEARRVKRLLGQIDEFDRKRMERGAAISFGKTGTVRPAQRSITRSLHHLTRRTLQGLASRLVPIDVERANRTQLVWVLEEYLLGGYQPLPAFWDGTSRWHVAALGDAAIKTRASFAPCRKADIEDFATALFENDLLNRRNAPTPTGSSRDDIERTLRTTIRPDPRAIASVIASMIQGLGSSSDVLLRLLDRYVRSWRSWPLSVQGGELDEPEGRRLGVGGRDAFDSDTLAGLEACVRQSLPTIDVSTLAPAELLAASRTSDLATNLSAVVEERPLDLDAEMEAEPVHLLTTIRFGVPFPRATASLRS